MLMVLYSSLDDPDRWESRPNQDGQTQRFRQLLTKDILANPISGAHHRSSRKTNSVGRGVVIVSCNFLSLLAEMVDSMLSCRTNLFNTACSHPPFSLLFRLFLCFVCSFLIFFINRSIFVSRLHHSPREEEKESFEFSSVWRKHGKRRWEREESPPSEDLW